jgi:hypothetical protein
MQVNAFILTGKSLKVNKNRFSYILKQINIGKVSIQSAACEKINISTFTVLLQIFQMPLTQIPISFSSSFGNLKSGIRYPFFS